VCIDQINTICAMRNLYIICKNRAVFVDKSLENIGKLDYARLMIEMTRIS
jgi:hypothetical protein